MKKIALYSIYLFSIIGIYAQDPDPRLFDTNWYLSMLAVGGNNIAIPVTSELETIPLFLTESRYETIACDGFGSDLNSFNDVSFIAEAWFILPMGCTQQSTLEFQDFYFEDFLKSAEFNIPFTYSLEEVGAEGLRLTVTNVDGDTAVYGNPALSIQEEQKVVVSIFPNPVKETIYIESNIPVVSTIVYNISGQKLLHTAKITNSNSIDVTVLPSGMYFITLFSETGQQQVQRFIKQ